MTKSTEVNLREKMKEKNILVNAKKEALLRKKKDEHCICMKKVDEVSKNKDCPECKDKVDDGKLKKSTELSDRQSGLVNKLAKAPAIMTKNSKEAVKLKFIGDGKEDVIKRTITSPVNNSNSKKAEKKPISNLVKSVFESRTLKKGTPKSKKL